MYQINQEKCSGCGLCARSCPQQAIIVEGKIAHILTDRCQSCGTCITACRLASIRPADSVVTPAFPPVRTPTPTLPIQTDWHTRHRQRVQRRRGAHRVWLDQTGLRGGPQ